MSAVKVETERRPGSTVVLSVEVPADQVSKSIDQAYSRLAPKVRIAGFRPGKAPRPMVERELGWPTLRQEALDLLLPTAYDAALDEAGLDPIDVPRVEVEQFDRGQPMKFRATVSIKPEITLRDYQDIRVRRPSTEVTEKDVDEAVDRLRARFAELHDVDRPVQAGDFLTVDTHILKGGATLVGESQTDAQLEVDKERLIPGLAEGLIGERLNETRDIRLKLPEDYPKKDLAGSDVIFRVTVKTIKERQLPPADDELAKQVGRGQTLQELRSQIHNEMVEAAHSSDEQRFENDVLKALDERMEVEVPEALIDREVNRDIRDLESRLQEQLGMRLDAYLQQTNSTLEVLRAERRPRAIQKVRLELALETVAEREGLTVSDEEVADAVNQAIADDPHPGHQRELRGADPVKAYFRHQLLMRKTIDYLSSVAAPETSDKMDAPAEPNDLEPAGASGSAAARSAGKRQER
ncbi:MAG TPA: trigger factor [Candidatus Dormibacteraeota bacterium]